MGKMFSLRNAAAMLGITTRTARDWVRKGKLAAIKYPASDRWYVDESEINRVRGDGSGYKD